MEQNNFTIDKDLREKLKNFGVSGRDCVDRRNMTAFQTNMDRFNVRYRK